MKKELILLFITILFTYSCSKGKEQNTDSASTNEKKIYTDSFVSNSTKTYRYDTKDSLLNKENDPKKRMVKNCIIESDLYVSLDKMIWGDSWIESSTDEEYIFRVLVASSGEEFYVYYETFTMGEDGPSKLLKRDEIKSEAVGMSYFDSMPEVSWGDNPKKLFLKFENNKYEIDLHI